MTTNNGQTGHEALRALRSIEPPAGMQERLVNRLAEHRRTHELDRAGIDRYARWLWTGAAMALACAAAVVCMVALQTGHGAHAHLEAHAPALEDLPAVARAVALPMNRSQHRRVRLEERPRGDAHLPHTAPPLPLTAQERMLLALASRPALAAGAAVSEPVADHGLGVNALFDLEEQPLPSMQTALLESDATPTPDSNPIPSGENK